jgi:NodT family efflux transporter outer membrane factor (OMF) lipoprotein
MNRIRFFRTASVAALLAAFAGCAVVGPNYQVPPQAAIKRPAAAAPFIGAQEAAFTSDPLPSNWWRLYRDATLDGLIEKAFRANTDLRVAAANLARARAVLDEAEELRHPEATLDAAPSYGRIAAATLALPKPLPNMGMYDAGVGVSYQVDMFGKIARAIEAVGADAQAAQAASELAHVAVAADTTRAYADACSAGREIAVARQSTDLQAQFVRLSEQRVRAGRGSALDLSRARSQLEQLHAAVPPLQAQQRVALYRLAVLTGEVPGTLPGALEQCSTAPKLAAPIPVGDGAALLRRRPDIRQAERILAGSVARIGVATADLYPSISLGMSVGSSGLLNELGAANAFRWSLGPLISWHLPSSGARSRIAQAQAGSDAALARFDGSVLNALRETESALTVYARELDRNAALLRARDQSALASQQTLTLYRAGRIDFLTTLDAQRTLAGTETALTASDAQLVTDQVALFLALGGGWDTEAPGNASATHRGQ